MRAHVFAGCLLLGTTLLSAVCLTPRDAAADFDPSGRNRKPKPKPPGPGKPAQPKPKPAEDGGTAGKGPSSDALIARYAAIVLSQPSAPFPLQRLSQLYRERDGNIKKLIEEFEKRAAATGPEAWASKVALAGIYKQDGRPEEAIKMYRTAIAERPDEPNAMLALANLESERGDKTNARVTYESALKILKPGPDWDQTTRTLLGLCLDLKDYEAAKKYHESLVKSAQGSLFVKAELGRELLGRGLYEKAEVEFRELVKAAAGDNRALAPALRDLGQVLAKQKKIEEALTTLKRGLAIAGSAAGVRSEILLIMTDAFRAEGKLSELIPILEAEKATDAQRLATLGGLYEETGEVEKAVATYRKVLAADTRQIDVRLRLVHLLQTAGELDAAIKEYEALIKAAPGNPDFVFELCETLIQRGDRPKALKLLTELEARTSNEPEILAAISDFYERIEEKDRALKVLQKLAGASGGDPTYIVDLGDRYYQAGDKKKALETWARIKTIIPNRGKAASQLGEVYLDHDMPLEALAAMREAVTLEPTNVRYKKNLAVAIERTAASLGSAPQRYAEARQIWEELLVAAGETDKLLAREARTHIVTLWSLAHELPSRIGPLQQRFQQTPPDIEAGRLLAEVQRRLQRLPDAEATLRKVTELAPGDEESLLALERILVVQQNLLGAIDVLAKLVEVNPKRAREFYQRMAQYAAELYRDDDAIKYAARAVELSPEDANGHQKLGDMYRRRQDFVHAIGEYRQAIAKNDRLFPVYFDLAELLLSSGQVDEADRLFRRVVRSSPDEELVARAARLSMQINLGKNSLDTLERELLPVAVGNPQKPLYRRLLVELYGTMTLPLVQRARHEGGTSPAASAAKAELAKIGSRAVKPLLDALSDDKESQQKIAIEVLAYVQNKSAGAALYNYATGQADKTLRIRAMIACGALRDPAILPKYESMLAPKDAGSSILPSDAIAVAAAWGVARMGDAKAQPLLVKLLASTSPEIRGVAALGLGLTHDKKYVPQLSALARAPEAGAAARASAMHALAEMGAVQQNDMQLLVALADSNDPMLRQAALIALARLSKGTDAGQTTAIADSIAANLFSTDESMRRTAASAATSLATKTFTRTGEALPVPTGTLSIREILAGLAADPARASERARALVALGPSLERAAIAAASTSPDRARVVADALLAGGTTPTLEPLLAVDDVLDPAAKKPATDTIERIAAAVVPAFVALVRHPAIEVRTRAVEFLAQRPEGIAQSAIVDALADPEESVRRAALAAIGTVKDAGTLAAVAKVGREAQSWPLRVRAAEALGRLGKGSDSKIAAETLATMAKADEYALVREPALRSLVALDKVAAEAVLREVAEKDTEPRIRAIATELLTGQTAKP